MPALPTFRHLTFYALSLFIASNAYSGENSNASYDITKSEYYTFSDDSEEVAKVASALKTCLQKSERPYDCITIVRDACLPTGTQERCAYQESTAWRKIIADRLVALSSDTTIKDDVAISQKHWEAYALAACRIAGHQVKRDSIQVQHITDAICIMRQDALRAIELY